MYGAIFGDLISSIYQKEEKYKENSLFNRLNFLSKDIKINEHDFYTKNTILTIAFIDAILNEKNFSEKMDEYNKKYLINNEFLSNFNENDALNSLSPIGFLLDNEESILKLTTKTAKLTHDSKDEILASIIFTHVIFLIRNKCSKEEIKTILKEKYNMNINFSLSKLQALNTYKNNILDILAICINLSLNSSNFENAINKVLSIGGNINTNLCITATLAEALYGIPDNFKDQVRQKIPEEFTEILENAYHKILNKNKKR